jgi:hypothetical protein
LVAARASVAPARRAAYREAVAALAAAAAARGGHLWVLEAPGPPRGNHRIDERPAGAPRDATLVELEQRLAALATYDASRDVCWDDVPLTSDRRE